MPNVNQLSLMVDPHDNPLMRWQRYILSVDPTSSSISSIVVIQSRT